MGMSKFQHKKLIRILGLHTFVVDSGAIYICTEDLPSKRLEQLARAMHGRQSARTRSLASTSNIAIVRGARRRVFLTKSDFVCIYANNNNLFFKKKP